MNTHMNKLTAFFLMMITSIYAGAQDDAPAMADSLRGDGKIYVVVGVIVIIFVSIIAFLVFIERKLARLERLLGGKDKKDQ